MTQLKIIAVLLLSMGLLSGAAHGSDSPASFVVVLESQEIFPYHMGTQGIVPDNPGASVEMLRIMESLVPVRIRFIRLPLNRSFIALEQGQAHGMIVSYKTSRLKYGRYPMSGDAPDNTKAIDYANYCLYVQHGSSVVWHPDDWTITGATKSIGAPYGYSIVTLLRQNRIKTDEYGNARENLVKLAAGRLDGAALLEFDADRILVNEAMLSGKIEKRMPPLSTRHYFLIVSHRFYNSHPGLSERIWDACRQIRINDRERIMARYLKLPI